MVKAQDVKIPVHSFDSPGNGALAISVNKTAIVIMKTNPRAIENRVSLRRIKAIFPQTHS